MILSGITDVHVHLIPGVDDGAVSLGMSMHMLEMAKREGVTKIFATPHFGPGSGFMKPFHFVEEAFARLKAEAAVRFPELEIYRGNEIYYEENCIPDWIEKGEACVMAGSKYVLFEFSPYCMPHVMERALLSVLDRGWRPILAHGERYARCHGEFNVFERLWKSGVCLQINAYSLVEEKDQSIKDCARRLAKLELAHFIGSDAHRDDRRPPSLQPGVEYLYENCKKEYADSLVRENVSCILGNVDISGQR